MHSTTTGHVPFRLVNPEGLYDPAPNGYSHVAVLDANTEVIHVSGQGGETQDGVLVDGFEGQVLQALRNLATALEAVGATTDDVAKLTVLIVEHDESKLASLGRALAATFGSRPMPACTLIPVHRLALDGMLFEVEATAVRKPTGPPEARQGA